MYSAWALVPFGCFIVAVEFISPQDIGKPIAAAAFKTVAGLVGISGALAASFLFCGMIAFCVLGDRAPIWKRAVWMLGLLAGNLLVALPYYFMIYRKQVE
jgi:hypothetical protein